MIGGAGPQIAQETMQEVQSMRNPLASDGSPATSSAVLNKLPWQCLAAAQRQGQGHVKGRTMLSLDYCKYASVLVFIRISSFCMH